MIQFRSFLSRSKWIALVWYWPTVFVLTMLGSRCYKFREFSHRCLLLIGQDLALAAFMGLIVHLLLKRRHDRQRNGRLTEGLIGLGVFIPALWISLLGLNITGMLKIPLDAKLLLQTPSLMFIRTALNTDSVANSLIKLSVLALGAPLVLGALWYALSGRIAEKRIPPLHPVVLASIIALMLACPWLATDEKYRDTNAVVTVISSTVGLVLSRMPPDPGLSPEQFADKIANLEASPESAPDAQLRELAFSGKQYDVLVLVLETGVAGVMNLEKPDPEWLPNLRRLAKRSLFCRKHLTPFANSTKSIFAVLTGLYPFPNFRSFIATWPRSRFQTLPSALAESGYSTGCYASIDGDFQRMDEFLGAHGIEHQGDRTSLQLSPLSDKTFGSDDELFQKYREWLTEHGEKPTFFVLLPSNSHWPFFFPETDRVFSEDDIVSRYRNALQHQDRLLGKHLDWLESTGRLRNTIVVVIADHGAYLNLVGLSKPDPAGLFEHHVPMLIDHPRLRERQSGIIIGRATSHVDIAPTILDMCTSSRPGLDCQGISLLRAMPRRRLVFFSRDYAAGSVAATDGESIAVWSKGRDRFTQWQWRQNFNSEPCSDPVEESVRRRVRLFYSYQTHYLLTLARNPE